MPAVVKSVPIHHRCCPWPWHECTDAGRSGCGGRSGDVTDHSHSVPTCRRRRSLQQRSRRVSIGHHSDAHEVVHPEQGQLSGKNITIHAEFKIIIIIIIIMAGMAVFNVAGYLIEERRRWPVITASPRGQCSK